MPIVTTQFLFRDLPLLLLSVALVTLNAAMVLGLIGYGVEPLRPLYLKMFGISVFNADDKKELSHAVIKLAICLGVTIVLFLPPVREAILLAYYKMFGGI